MVQLRVDWLHLDESVAGYFGEMSEIGLTSDMGQGTNRSEIWTRRCWQGPLSVIAHPLRRIPSLVLGKAIDEHRPSLANVLVPKPSRGKIGDRLFGYGLGIAGGIACSQKQR